MGLPVFWSMDQHLDDEQQIAFSRLYGPLEVSPLLQGNRPIDW